jgi:hypothetical protein
MKDLTDIDNICLISSCTSSTYYRTRVLIRNFIDYNTWFDGEILILTLESDPIGEGYKRLANSIYNKIKFIEIPNSEILELKNNVDKRNKYSSLIDYAHIFAFKIKSKGNIFVSNNVTIVGDISSILNNNVLSISTDSVKFPNAGDNILPYLMFVPTKYINDVTYKSVYDHAASSVINGTHQYMLPFIKESSIQVNKLSSNIMADMSIFTNNKYSNFRRYRNSISSIYVNDSILHSNKYTSLQAYWNQLVKSSNNLNSPSKRIISAPNIKSNVDESSIKISVIIPAYKAEGYIKECLDSILNQTSSAKLEILVGIDNCNSTSIQLNKIKDTYPNLRVFLSDTSVGPYIMRNTLLDFAKYDNILFFDADDIMKPGMVSNILRYYTKNSPIRFKYLNFQHGKPYTSGKSHPSVAHGVFFSSREILDIIGGFQPWMCGADTEFMKRCAQNGIRDVELQDYVFYRRIHGNSLTINTATNHRSKVRDNAKRFIRTNRDWSIPIVKKTTELSKI